MTGIRHHTASAGGHADPDEDPAQSRARLLVLTHFSQRYDHDGSQRLADEAAAAYGGEIVLARDLARIPVPPRP